MTLGMCGEGFFLEKLILQGAEGGKGPKMGVFRIFWRFSETCLFDPGGSPEKFAKFVANIKSCIYYHFITGRIHI